jgi:O-antigen/teichoic acid export membrane protein
MKAMLQLALGSAAARAITILALPFLARIYEPAEFGLAALFSSLTLLLVPFVTLRYEQALPLPKTAKMAQNLFFLCLLVAFLMWCVISFILIIAPRESYEYIGFGRLADMKFALIISVLVAAIFEIFSNWATREKAYSTILKGQLFQSTFGVLTKSTLGLLFSSSTGLIIGQVSSILIGLVYFSIKFCRKIKADIKHVTLHHILQAAYIYFDFPKFRIATRILIVASTQTPIILSNIYFDTTVTGQLSLATMSVTLTVSLIAEAMSRAHYSELSTINIKKPDQIRTILKASLRKIAIFSLVPTIILLASGDSLYSLALGENWALAGALASLLAISLPFQMGQVASSTIYILFRRQKLLLFLVFTRFSGSVAVFSLAAGLLGADITVVVAALSVFFSVHYSLETYLAVRLTRRVN